MVRIKGRGRELTQTPRKNSEMPESGSSMGDQDVADVVVAEVVVGVLGVVVVCGGCVLVVRAVFVCSPGLSSV